MFEEVMIFADKELHDVHNDFMKKDSQSVSSLNSHSLRLAALFLI